MGRTNSSVYSPRVSSTLRSAVTALLSFVALPAIPLGSTLDLLIELVCQIADVSHTSRRQELIDFGEYVGRVVNQTLDKILHNMYYINSSGSFITRFRRALFPQEDRMEVFRMRQQLDDALNLFKFAATCELLVRPHNLPQVRQDECPGPNIQSRLEPREHGSLNTPELTQANLSSAYQNYPHQWVPLPYKQRTRPRRGAFIAAAPPNLEDDELITVSREVKDLRRSFHRSRKPLLAMQLALALGRYSYLLAQVNRTAEALVASQESANLFKALAENGPEIYYDLD